MCLPPLKPARLAHLKRELALIPERHREDAVQEAWVTHLEGKDPVRAAKAYAFREKWHEQKVTPFSQLE